MALTQIINLLQGYGVVLSTLLAPHVIVAKLSKRVKIRACYGQNTHFIRLNHGVVVNFAWEIGRFDAVQCVGYGSIVSRDSLNFAWMPIKQLINAIYKLSYSEFTCVRVRGILSVIRKEQT
jgi:hypothetical protein